MHNLDHGHGIPHRGGLLDVPDELLLHIFNFIDLQDIIALRKTCVALCALTKDRHAWLQMLRDQSFFIPLPPHLQHPSSWASLSTEDLETLVHRLGLANRRWLLPRTHYFIPGHQESCVLDPVFDNDDGARTIHSIDIFLDRWLLCIYQEKLVELWDLDAVVHNPLKPILCTSQAVNGAGSFSSAMTQLGHPDNILTIAVSCHELCHVMQVQLYHSRAMHALKGNDSEEVQFRTIVVIPFASPIFSLRALAPEQSLLLLGLPSSFHLLNWNTRQRTIVTMLSEEEEELWNGVVAATFLTRRHILVLKAHSLEICTLLDSPQLRMHGHDSSRSLQTHTGSLTLPTLQMSAAVHSHFFPSTTFRGVSFSQPITHSPSTHDDYSDADTDCTIVSLTFLAYDVLRGIFHCSVSVIIPSPADPNPQPHVFPPPIDVQVRLIAAHNMATAVPPGTEHGPRSGMSHGARGFVSACALGPAGRRGVWVERRRGAVRRVVYGFSANPVDSDGEDDGERVEFIGIVPPSPHKQGNLEKTGKGGGQGKGKRRKRWTKTPGFQPGTPVSAANAELDADSAPSEWNAQDPRAIEGKEVYEVNSFDLRDDITHIAFSETTGLIALGTRKGEIRVLGRPDQVPNGL